MGMRLRCLPYSEAGKVQSEVLASNQPSRRFGEGKVARVYRGARRVRGRPGFRAWLGRRPNRCAGGSEQYSTSFPRQHRYTP